ncbi:MAG: hypothetical protein LUM44_02325 [Pyrinomonadaceae bacterium]|nr:hypothetical protein [Pyrinomonadaceae bacterium]
MTKSSNYTNKGKRVFILSFLLLLAVSTLAAQVRERKELINNGSPTGIEQKIEDKKSEDVAGKTEALKTSENEIAESDKLADTGANAESVAVTEKVTIDKAIFEKKSFGANEFQPPSIFGRKKASDGKNVRNYDSKTSDAADIENGIDWKSAFNQSLLFLGIQHGYAFTQAKTRRALKGNFFKDYVDSVKSLHGWEDGGRFFTNYIAHPMQGSFTGFILVQNDRKGRQAEFGTSKTYWHSRLKALAWSAAWSTQFEIGPISQASIGNVGLSGKQTWVDIVMTPTAGFAMMVAEDAADKYLVKRIEQNFNNYYLKIFSRMLLNPTRTMANLTRFKLPWYRDNR